MPRAASDPMIGRTIAGRYHVRDCLGAGSMGTVYRARQLPMGREVAFKILHHDHAVNAESKARFLREAQATSSLFSEHTVTVYDFGEADSGELFLAMEALDGESLGARLKRVGAFRPNEAVSVALQVLNSLAEAHQKGIIHRDLKPDNLFFSRTRDGSNREIVKVLDFGIAKVLHDEQQRLSPIETAAGTVFGTPRYMSPEQAQGRRLDTRSDLYSLGVMLYHMLVGHPPYTDDDAILVMAHHIKTIPASPSSLGISLSEPLERVLMQALEKRPCDRPATAAAFASLLIEAANDPNAPLSGPSGARQSHPSFPPVSAPSAPALAGSNPLWFEGAKRSIGFVAAIVVLAAGTIAAGATVLMPPRTQAIQFVSSALVALPRVPTASVINVPDETQAGNRAVPTETPREPAVIVAARKPDLRSKPPSKSGAQTLPVQALVNPPAKPSSPKKPTYERFE